MTARRSASTQNANAALTVEYAPIETLRPNPSNPRGMLENARDALDRSMAEFGFIEPIIVRREDHTIIGGHMRVQAARRLGRTEVPVIFVDVSEAQARALNLALNRIHGQWDEVLLARLLAELDADPDIDISLTGFADDEIQRLLRTLDAREKHHRLETFDVDAALAQAGPTRAAVGDVWRLGDHRVLCGDSTNPADVAHLVGDATPVLMNTDPPYLVNYQGGDRSENRHRHPSTKDPHWDDYEGAEASVEFYVNFLAAGLAHLPPRAAIYQWHAHRRQALVEQAWKQAGLLVHQQIIWAKPAGVPGRSHYMWSHEPAFYGWVEGRSPKRKPPKGTTTVWMIDSRGEQFGVHPTQKPLELFMRPIEYHTEPGDVIYEPFLGSGTQLIAAERTGRACFAIEQEPRYVDVAIARWEAFTGETAERTEDET